MPHACGAGCFFQGRVGESQFKPVGKHADTQQGFGRRVRSDTGRALLVERVGVAAFDLHHAPANGDRGFGEVGPIGDNRLVELWPAIAAAAIRPVE